jgi:hypothetical protein
LLEFLGVAAVPCGALDFAEHRTAESLGVAAVPCGALDFAEHRTAESLGLAAVPCGELVNAAVSCGSRLSSQRPPAEFTW